MKPKIPRCREFVYVAQVQGQPLIKVGESRNPVARVAQLQAGAGGLPMQLLGYFVGARNTKEALHGHLAEHRVAGAREWFHLNGAVTAWLDSMGMRPVDALAAAEGLVGSDVLPEPLGVAAERHFSTWLAEAVELDAAARQSAGDFFRTFTAWCAAQRLQPVLSQRAFGDALQRHGIVRAGKDAAGRILRRGARLRIGAESR